MRRSLRICSSRLLTESMQIQWSVGQVSVLFWIFRGFSNCCVLSLPALVIKLWKDSPDTSGSPSCIIKSHPPSASAELQAILTPAGPECYPFNLPPLLSQVLSSSSSRIAPGHFGEILGHGLLWLPDGTRPSGGHQSSPPSLRGGFRGS